MARIEQEIRLQFKRWKESGHDDACLLNEYKAALAHLWLHHHQEIDQSREEIQAFINKSLSAFGDVKDLWRQRHYCPGCGERYKLENMETCTDCLESYCWRCISSYKNENRACSCGGEFY